MKYAYTPSFTLGSINCVCQYCSNRGKCRAIGGKHVEVSNALRLLMRRPMPWPVHEAAQTDIKVVSNRSIPQPLSCRALEFGLDISFVLYLLIKLTKKFSKKDCQNNLAHYVMLI